MREKSHFKCEILYINNTARQKIKFITGTIPSDSYVKWPHESEYDFRFPQIIAIKLSKSDKIRGWGVPRKRWVMGENGSNIETLIN